MSEKFVSGVRMFDRRENQPDFVLGSLVITPDDIMDWVKQNPDKVSEYNGKRQVKFQVKRSREGKVYIELDTYGTPGHEKKPSAAKTSNNGIDDLGF